MKIKFLGKEYSLEEFETEVDIFNLTEEQLEEYEYLFPHYLEIETGYITSDCEGQNLKSTEKILIDRRYLTEIDIEVLESRNLQKFIQ